jgi:cytochrome b561
VSGRWPVGLRLVHWLTAALVAVTIPLAWRAQALTEIDTDRAEALIGLHILIGLALFALTIIRLAIRRRAVSPPPAAAGPLARHAAAAMAAALYALLLLMPVTGVLKLAMSGLGVSAFGMEIVPSLGHLPAVARTLNATHALAAKLLIALVVAHAAMAIMHRRITGRPVLHRMFFAVRR